MHKMSMIYAQKLKNIKSVKKYKKKFDNRRNGWYYKRAVGEFNRTIFENWIRKKPRKRQFRIKKRKMSENI